MSDSDEKLAITIKEKRGLIYCHNRKIHGEFNSSLFPQLVDIDIKWNYIDIQGDEEPGQIIGSVYEPDVIFKARKLNRKGYDYILQSACAGITALDKFRAFSVLSSAIILLKSGGVLIFPHFPKFIFEILGFFPKSDKSVEKLSAKEKHALIKKRQDKVIELLADDKIMNEDFYPYINILCQIFGYKSYEVINFTNERRKTYNYMYFYK